MPRVTIRDGSSPISIWGPSPPNFLPRNVPSAKLARQVNSLNVIKILANSLIVIDPIFHRHKKIPSILFSGIQGIDENFNGIQGINSNNKQLQLRFLEMNPHVWIRPVTAVTVRSVSMKFL